VWLGDSAVCKQIPTVRLAEAAVGMGDMTGRRSEPAVRTIRLSALRGCACVRLRVCPVARVSGCACVRLRVCPVARVSANIHRCRRFPHGLRTALQNIPA
jgi:hypothetical protein